jgi:ankyrin repeat protein
MDCENATESPAKVFAFTEYSDGLVCLFPHLCLRGLRCAYFWPRKILKSYSRGNGRFFTEIPSSGLTITFGLTKTADSLDITIYDDSLIQWLRTFPSLRDCLDSSKVSMAFSSHGAFPSVNMDVLLPCYSELSAEFDRYKRERRSFDALDLFVFHFLREGSVFAAFGVENLHEKQILTDLHLNHIQSQYSSMSEDLDRLDEMACGLDKPDKMDEPFKLAQFECVAGLGIICEIINRLVLAEFSQMDEPFRSDLLVAVKQRDFTAVSKLLARTLFRVDSGILCRAIECYEPTIFHLLLEHGADVQGYCRQPLYVAARAGQMDALRQLLNHGGHVNSSRSSPTPLEGAVDGGHFEIVRYLVEEHAAKIDGHKYMSMLSSTFDNGRREIYDYLLRSTVALPRQYHRQLSVCSTTGPASVYSEEDLNGLAISTAGISSHTRDLLLLMGRSQTYLEVVKVLVNSNMDIGSMQQTSPLYRAAVNGHLDLVRFLFKRATTIPTADIILLIWNAAENGHLEVADFLLGYNPDIYPILLATMMHLAAISANHHAIVQLTRLGAVIDAKDHQSPLWTGVQCGYRKVFFCQGTTTDADASAQPEVADEDALEGPPYQCPYAKTLGPTQCCHWDLIDLLEKHCAKITDVETCPTVAAIRARERRAIAHRLFAEIKSSRETLLEAGARHNVSDGLGAFMGQVGTHLSIWKSGTRAIRDISEGYMPSGLHDIVSALQVADAMRLAVPSSKIVCSNKE